MPNAVEARIISSRYPGVCRLPKCGKPYARGDLIAWAGRGIAYHPQCCPFPIENPEVVGDPLGPVVALGERIGHALATLTERFGTDEDVRAALSRGIQRALQERGVRVGVQL